MSRVEPVRRVRNDARLRFIAVSTIVYGLIGVALYDGGGFAFGGPSVTSGPSYAVLRLVPGGMRAWGVALLVGSLALTLAISRGTTRQLHYALQVGVAYYLCWSFVVPATWLYLHQIPAWGAWSKFAALAALYLTCARATTPSRARRAWWRSRKGKPASSR